MPAANVSAVSLRPQLLKRLLNKPLVATAGGVPSSTEAAVWTSLVRCWLKGLRLDPVGLGEGPVELGGGRLGRSSELE